MRDSGDPLGRLPNVQMNARPPAQPVYGLQRLERGPAANLTYCLRPFLAEGRKDAKRPGNLPFPGRLLPELSRVPGRCPGRHWTGRRSGSYR